MIRFYGFFRSSSAYRCRIAFNMKGLDYDFIPVHLRKDGGHQKKENYRAINPQGLVPALDVDSEFLTQSLAIIEWLDETHPESPLLPEDPLLKAKVRAFALSIACEIHPLQNLRVLEHLRGQLGLQQEAIDDWCRHWNEQGLAACEAILQKLPETEFCFGSTPSLADICLVPQVFSAERFGTDLSNMPRLRKIAEHCNSLDAFAKARPAQQPDAE